MKVESVKTASVEPHKAASEKKEQDGVFAELVGLMLNMLAPAGEPAVPAEAPLGEVQNASSVQSSREIAAEQVILSLLESKPEAQGAETSVPAQILATMLDKAFPLDLEMDKGDKADAEIETKDLPVQTGPADNPPVSEDVSITSYVKDTTPTNSSQGRELPAVAQESPPVAEMQQERVDIVPQNQQVPAYSVIEPRAGQVIEEPPSRQGQSIEVKPTVAISPSEAPIVLRGVLPPVEATSLQALRTEIVSFTKDPGRPAVVLEVSPPEYGRVLVSAERDATGQVTIRLVVENYSVKAAVMEQLPPLPTSASVVVVTVEEHREWREQGQRRRNQHEKPTPKKEPDHKVEFVV